MSVLEKKALAFEKLAALQNEKYIDEILAHLNQFNNDSAKTDHNLSSHLESVKSRYSETLKKLAE